MCGFCQTVYQWIWTSLVQAITAWAQRCSRRRCKWWCLCCNKWFCWLIAVLVYIVALVLALLITIICVICYVLCYIVCFLACVLNKLFGKPAPGNCFTDCIDVCSGKQSPANVIPGGGTGITTPTVGGGSGGGVSGSNPLEGGS